MRFRNCLVATGQRKRNAPIWGPGGGGEGGFFHRHPQFSFGRQPPCARSSVLLRVRTLLVCQRIQIAIMSFLKTIFTFNVATVTCSMLFIVIGAIIFFAGGLEEIVIRQSSYTLECICGPSTVGSYRVYTGNGVTYLNYRLVWNVTNCQYPNGSTFLTGQETFQVTDTLNGWGSCKDKTCAGVDAGKMCPLNVRRSFFFSALHGTGYMRKHYSVGSVLVWYLSSILVGCAILLLGVILVVQGYYRWCYKQSADERTPLLNSVKQNL